MTLAPDPKPLAPLSACPFCGSSAQAVETPYALPNGRSDITFHIECQRRECGCRTIEWYPLIAAIAVWNRRVPSAEADARRWNAALNLGFPVRNQSPSNEKLRWTVNGEYFGSTPTAAIDAAMKGTR